MIGDVSSLSIKEASASPGNGTLTIHTNVRIELFSGWQMIGYEGDQPNDGNPDASDECETGLRARSLARTESRPAEVVCREVSGRGLDEAV